MHIRPFTDTCRAHSSSRCLDSGELRQVIIICWRICWPPETHGCGLLHKAALIPDQHAVYNITLKMLNISNITLTKLIQIVVEPL